MPYIYPANWSTPIEVDDEDFIRVNQHNWHIIMRNGRVSTIRGSVNGKQVSLTHFILNCYGKMVDHKDRNIFNNKKENLRFCDYLDNNKNRRGHFNSTSKYKGVSWNTARKCWVAAIRYRGITYAKRFIKETDAAKWYNEQAKKYFGDFAYLNVVE